MKLIIVYLIIIVLFVNHCACEIWPIVVTPKQFRYNVEENIVIISNKNESIQVLLNDYNSLDSLYNKTFDINTDEALQIPVKVNTSSPSLDKVLLTVISESGEKRESFIKFLPKSGYAFIQTDKPIYTPKESVRIRMIRLDEQLKPLNEKIKLRIKNSQKIIVEETTFTPSEPNYFVDYKFDFPPLPRLGIWFADLLYGRNYSSNYTVSFELKEYVLPTFSIKIKSPKFIVPSTINVSGSVEVDYVYGKPVNGTVVFRFGNKEKNGKVSYIGSTDLKQLSNGSASYFFETNQFRQLPLAWFPLVNGFRFVVEVTVHERVTGKKDKAIDDSGLFVNSPYVISFKNAFSDFKPNIETYVTAEVRNVLGEPVPDLPVYLHLMDERGTPIKPLYISSNISSSLIHSDHLGRISFPITLKEKVEQLHVTLRTSDPKLKREEQAEAAHVMFAYESGNEFISIANKAKYSTSLRVGETYQSAFIIRGAINLSQIYLIVVNRGNILHSEKVLNEREIKLNVTREMVPNIRIFVFAISRSNQIVSDSIKINVLESNCGFDIDPQINGIEVLPGRAVNLTLNGSKGDSVALLGVDEAVYILRDEDRLTKNKIIKELEKSDLGCGPGGGLNTMDVAKNVGLKLIASKSEYLDNSIDTCRKTIRVKREISSIFNIYQGLLRKCCILGMWPSNKRRNCQHKASILKEYMPQHQECYTAFLSCCKAYTQQFPIVSASVPTHGVTLDPVDRTRIGSGSEEFVHIAYEQDTENRAFVRSDFRETWLFDLVVLDKSSVEYEVTFPHSITTWSLIGMSISPNNGLCIMSSPYRLKTFQDVFIQVSLPYSVVQNEQMEMIATVFNYGNKRLNILIYFVGVEDICSEAPEAGKKARKHLIIEANSFGTVAFPMVPLRAGTYNLKVVAMWSLGSDVVIKTLNVIPPGTPIEEDLTFQLDPRNRQRRAKRHIKTSRISDEIKPDSATQGTTVKIQPHSNNHLIVPNTKECIVAGIADPYGAAAFTTLNDVDGLIRQPKGCGEQTMLFMAPTLFTLKYLNSADKLNGDLKHRGLKYLKEGYKRELSFRKDDGSFSAFPTRPPSVWLTAFVMKVFCQSFPNLNEDQFDPQVIEKGLLWLENKQEYDGSWSESHPVVHESALGGIKGTIPLTAYILIAFHECSNIFPREKRLNGETPKPFSNVIKKSEEFLIRNQNQLIKQKNTYAMGLLAYSLTFTNSSHAFGLMNALHDMANYDKTRNYKYWRSDYEVEATSYALMAILKSGVRDSLDALSIVNWLNDKRSFTGSFDSTQDTIVALEALSLYADTQRSSTSDTFLYCNVTSDRFRRSLVFNKDNALVLQKFKVEAENNILNFTTTGNGMGQMSIKLKYNVLEPPEVLCKFEINIKIEEWKSPPESRGEPVLPTDIGEDFFNDFSSDLLNSLDLKNRRSKRSFWDRNPITRAYNRFRSGTPESVASNEKSVTPEPVVPKGRGRSASITDVRNDLNININDEQNSEKNNLSRNAINNNGISKLVLVLEICIRYIPRYNSEMSIIEVGLLSGYKPHKDDLEEILNVKDSLVSKYEISDRNLVIYFDKVPFGKPYCIQFRKIQEHSVSNSQAAIIKVYDYYKSDHGCSQLYTPTRISEYIETKCNSDVCQCAKRENCPTDRSLTEIGTIAEKRIIRARELFQELVCSPKYHYVSSGRFVQQNQTKHGVKLLRFIVNIAFKGSEEKGHSFWVNTNRECNDLSTRVDREVIIFGQINENTRQLNGSSIVYDITDDLRIDETRSNVLVLINWLDNKIKRESWNCAQT